MGAKGSKPSTPMGKVPTVPKNTPLAYILDNWRYFPGTLGKDKQKMIKYCTRIWGGKKISKDVVWPVYGSEEDWVRQQLNLWVNNKKPLNPEESQYAEVWLERPRARLYPLNEVKTEQKKKKEELDETLLTPPPYISPPAPAAPSEVPRVPTPPPESEQGSPPPPRRVTRSQKGAAQMYPLREMPMGGPQPVIGYIFVPLSSADLRDFKRTEMGNLIEDPLGVAERLDQFLGPNLYTWDEMQSILGQLFTTEERDMIRRAGMRLWNAQHAQGPQADIKWPLQRPNWDNQDPVHRTHMQDLRTIVIQGIREAVPRGQNINKAFNEIQKKDESPTEWLERLRKALQLYSGVNPDDPLGQALLKTQFVAKSWEDIRKKIEKLEDWQNRGLDELLREAQKVYVRREEESSKRQVKMMVAAVREDRKGRTGEHRSAGTKQGNVVVKKEQRCCFYCGKKGHIKTNCRERIRDEEILKTE